MVISADDGRECCRQIRCDPDGVGRNGRSRFFEFGTDVRIAQQPFGRFCGLVSDVRWQPTSIS
jgi:hypothetical protein